MMRIITGSARGTKLAAPEGMTTRPTAERAKEAVFSSLQFGIRGRTVLDLFAGSGQMGLEALSRGAAFAVFCDSSPEAVAVIKKNAEKTHLSDRCRIVGGDSLDFLRTSARALRFDIVFIDPPYASGLVPKCLAALADHGLLNKDAVVICETARGADPFGGDAALKNRFEILKESVYGAAYVTIIKPRAGGSE